MLEEASGALVAALVLYIGAVALGYVRTPNGAAVGNTAGILLVAYAGTRFMMLEHRPARNQLLRITALFLAGATLMAIFYGRSDPSSRFEQALTDAVAIAFFCVWFAVVAYGAYFVIRRWWRRQRVSKQ